MRVEKLLGRLRQRRVLGREMHPLSGCLIVSHGLPKSASSFAWLLLRDILRVGGAPLVKLSAEAKGAPSEEDYVDSLSAERLAAIGREAGAGCALVKTHGFAPRPGAIEAAGFAQQIVFAQHRDPRDIALSLIDHGNRSRAAGIADFVECVNVERSLWTIDLALKTMESWLELGEVHLVSYDALCFDSAATVARMAKTLKLRVDPAEILAPYADKRRITQFNKGVPQRWRTEMSAEDAARVRAEFARYYERFA